MHPPNAKVLYSTPSTGFLNMETLNKKITNYSKIILNFKLTHQNIGKLVIIYKIITFFSILFVIFKTILIHIFLFSDYYNTIIIIYRPFTKIVSRQSKSGCILLCPVVIIL